MMQSLIAQYVKQSCHRWDLLYLRQKNVLKPCVEANVLRKSWHLDPSTSQTFRDRVLLNPVVLNPVSVNPVVLDLVSSSKLAKGFSWIHQTVLRKCGGPNSWDAAIEDSVREPKKPPPARTQGSCQLAGSNDWRPSVATRECNDANVSEAASLKALKGSKEVNHSKQRVSINSLVGAVSGRPAFWRSDYNASFIRLFHSENSGKGSKEGPKQEPEKDKPFMTPFDILKEQMANDEPQSGGVKNAQRAGSKSEEVPWEEVSKTSTDAAQILEAATVDIKKPKTIDFLNVHSEKMAELKALEELTFDDVNRWGSEHVAPVPADVKALTASALTEIKLHLIGAYYELQIVPMRKLFSWAIPTEEALQAIKEASPNGVVEVGAGSGYWAALLRERGVNVRAFDRAPVDQKHNGHHSPVTSEQLEALGKRVGRTIKATFDAELVQRLGFGSVNEGGPEEAGKFPARSLLLCWPPDETDPDAPTDVQSMGVNALKAYRGSTLIYVGEKIDGGGSTSGRIDGGSSASGRIDGATSTSGKIDGGGITSEDISRTAGPKFARSLKRGGWALQKEVELPHWPQCEDTLQIWTRQVGHVAAPEPPDPEGGGSTLPRLRERFEALAAACKEVGSDATKQTGLGVHVVKDDDKSRRLQHEAQNLFKDVNKMEKEARDARFGPLAREVYMLGLRELWDDVARELIWRRVHREGAVRGGHTPFAPIEKAILERHMARQGLFRRLILRYTYGMMKRMEDK